MSPWLDVTFGLNLHPLAPVSINTISSLCECASLRWNEGSEEEEEEEELTAASQRSKHSNTLEIRIPFHSLRITMHVLDCGRKSPEKTHKDTRRTSELFTERVQLQTHNLLALPCSFNLPLPLLLPPLASQPSSGLACSFLSISTSGRTRKGHDERNRVQGLEACRQSENRGQRSKASG
ncbi:unnamed protein product [Pleuronectes platessa]|uniref:Uncharacterized protein n=1 Tax=Pleuronectes platessa TaxID=8262 RepID=A0A9N7Z1B6_PLEPL|nr:unnamed protein product [Pleuronectes platessa]